MQALNPYAPPKASLEAAPDQRLELWRDGKVLVCRREAVFPARCVKCNEAAAPPPARYKLSWHHPGWYVLIFVYIFIYVIAAFIVRKRATVHVGLCETHQGRRRWGRIVGWGGIAAIIAAVAAGIAWGIDPLISAGLIGLLPWAIATVLLLPQLYAARIGKQFIRVKGCGRDFLAGLPEFIE